MKVVRVKKADADVFETSIKKDEGFQEKVFGYVALYRGGRGSRFWEMGSLRHPNVVFGNDIAKLKAFHKEIEKQAKDLKDAIAFMEKENKQLVFLNLKNK